mgnify:CR=1 FL=1
MAFKMNKNKAGSLYKKSVYKNSTSFTMLDKSSMKKDTDTDRTVTKNDPEFAALEAVKSKINTSASKVNTPGVVVSGETLASARKRVQETEKAYKASGAYSSEDKKRYKAMGLTNAKQFFNQKVKENEAAAAAKREQGETQE